MGIDPKIWGASAWTIIHVIALHLKSEDDFRHAKHILYSFLHILPCEKCRKNYDSHLVFLPIPERMSYVWKWTYDLHNRVSNKHMDHTTAKNMWASHGQLTLQDTIPFLESVAATHPGAAHINSIYRDNLYNFIISLMHFLNIKCPEINKQSIVSRTTFKCWLKKLKRSNNVSYTTINRKECSETCVL